MGQRKQPTPPTRFDEKPDPPPAPPAPRGVCDTCGATTIEFFGLGRTRPVCSQCKSYNVHITYLGVEAARQRELKELEGALDAVVRQRDQLQVLLARSEGLAEYRLEELRKLRRELIRVHQDLYAVQQDAMLAASATEARCFHWTEWAKDLLKFQSFDYPDESLRDLIKRRWTALLAIEQAREKLLEQLRELSK